MIPRCSLGDVTNDDACYQKALEVSNDKSARAKVIPFLAINLLSICFLCGLYVNTIKSVCQRSLARSAYNRGEYQTSKILW